jgi:hypothetical protein
VTMAAGWCGERAPRPWWGHMEIRPDHWWEKVGQGAPPRRGARGGSEPGWVSHDPHDPHHHVLSDLGGHHAPHPRSAPGGGAPRREAGSEAEDGCGAATSAREVEDEGVVEAGGW